MLRRLQNGTKLAVSLEECQQKDYIPKRQKKSSTKVMLNSKKEMATMALVPRKHDFFDDFFTDPFDLGFFGTRPAMQPVRKSTPTLMKTDIRETEDAFEIEIDLPGFKKENVHAEIENGYLTIQASTETETEDKDEKGTYLRKERFTGSCRRSFYVGEDVSEEDIKAKFDNGILSITVPKKQELPEPETKKLIAIEG